MSSYKDFVSVFKEPSKLPITDPFTGDETGEYFLIHSISGPIGAEALNSVKDDFRGALAGANDDPEKLNEVGLGIADSVAPMLIAGWSFKEKMTKAKAKEVCSDNPGLANGIFAHACDKDNWRKKK